MNRLMPAPSTILQALGTGGGCSASAGKYAISERLVSLALVVAVVPLLSTCSKAGQTQPKSHISPIEAWSGRTDVVAAIRSSDSVSGREADIARAAPARPTPAPPTPAPSFDLRPKKEHVAGCSNPTATSPA
jgi:hypothetical protein